jgi:periplasmic divalent cation tolerance protein
MSRIVLILTSVPSDAVGEELATALVTERLAACVNVGAAMTSIYRWKSKVERETERQLVIKTTSDRVTAVQQRIKELHPYELPEFVVIEVSDGSDEYLEWIIAESQS